MIKDGEVGGRNYRYHVDAITASGREASPRGLNVTELMNKSVRFHAGEMIQRERINYKLGFMEGLQLLAGVFDVGAIERIAPNAKLDLFSEQSAYGPRVRKQIPAVIQALKDDPTTRQAVLVFVRPEEAGIGGAPCTLAAQFQIREHIMDTIITMRSSDAVYGLPYDVMQFGMLAQAIARCVGLSTSARYLDFNLGNAHIYSSTKHLRPTQDRPLFFRFDFKVPTHWPGIVQWATNAIAGKRWIDGAPEGVVVKPWTG